jgi:hypothetical protein
MSELPDRKDEQMARLLAVGVTADEAYWRSGRKRDRSNAAKKAKSPAIAARVAELIEEELERQRQVRMSSVDVAGVDELRKALIGAASSGQWSAAVTASKALAEIDGSADKLSGDREQTMEELVAMVDKHNDPVASLGARLMWVKTSFEHPVRTADDLELIVRGLEHYLGNQLPDLSARLAKAAAAS